MQLNDNADAAKITARIKDIPKQHVKEGKEEVLLHPMDKWHLYSDFKNGKIVGGAHSIRLAVWYYRRICITVSLYQFHEFEYGEK